MECGWSVDGVWMECGWSVHIHSSSISRDRGQEEDRWSMDRMRNEEGEGETFDLGLMEGSEGSGRVLMLERRYCGIQISIFYLVG